MYQLQKLLDNTPKQVYNIFKKDGEGFDLSSISKETVLENTLYTYYKAVRDTYNNNPDLFPTPPVFAGGFFRDIYWGGNWPSDLDLFFNSHGMEKEEAEDSLCLFLSNLGYSYELDNAAYAGLGSMRIFNCTPSRVGEVRCHLQAILKDMGPPEDDPLYVTNDFHYNHAKAVLPVVGDPEIHYHGHAVAGREHKIHVAYRERGMNKCKEKFFGSPGFRYLDFTVDHVVKPKSGLKAPNTATSLAYGKYDVRTKGAPIRPDGAQYFQVREWYRNVFDHYFEQVAPPPLNVLEAQRAAIAQRNEFVNQFDPLRNNRRPLP